jgi:hypothetical protein
VGAVRFRERRVEFRWREDLGIVGVVMIQIVVMVSEMLMQRSNKTVQVFIIDAHLASEVMFDSNHKPLDQVQSHPFLSHDLEHLLLASLRSA